VLQIQCLFPFQTFRKYELFDARGVSLNLLPFIKGSSVVSISFPMQGAGKFVISNYILLYVACTKEFRNML